MTKSRVLASCFWAGILILGLQSCTPSSSPQDPTLTITYNAEEQPTEKSSVAQVLQSQLRGKGISVRLDPVSNTLYAERIARGDFEATLTLWYLDYDDPEGFLTDLYSKAGYRVSRYSSPEFDHAYLAGLFASAKTEKLRWFQSAEAEASRNLPWIPLYSNSEVFLMKPEASAFQSNAYQYYDYRYIPLAQIRAASDVEVQTLDPALAYDLASKHLIIQSYEGLVSLNQDAEITPALAREWRFSPNKDVLRFELRHDVRFHDGPVQGPAAQRIMTADDVKASFERLLRSNSPYTYIFDYVRGVDDFRAGRSKHVAGFRVVNAHAFEIWLTKPFPTMLPWLLAPAAYVLPEGLPNNYDFSRGSAGTGPFVLRTWDGVTAKFEANSFYWQTGPEGQRLPYARTLVIRIIKDTNTAFTAFRQGSLDILNVPPALFNEVFESDGRLRKQWSGHVSREMKLNNLKFLAFNMDKPPWGTNLQLRQKVAEAIDRQAIVERLLRGKARPATSIIPTGVVRVD